LRSSENELGKDGVRSGVGGKGDEVGEKTVSKSCLREGARVQIDQIIIAIDISKLFRT